MNTRTFFRLLAQVNWLIARRRVADLRQQSWLMITVIATFVLAYWVAGYWVFYAGFIHLAKFPAIGVILLDRMLYLFFAFLFLMLIFSNMIIGYSSLFKSQETQWLLTLPVKHADLFRWKLFETALLASWAFLFLAAPLMLAYGTARQVTGAYYVKVVLLFLPFTMIPAALGSLVILLITRYLHRRMFKWALFGLSAVVISAAIVFLRPVDVEQFQQAQMVATLNQLLRNSHVTVQPMLPSYWVASSMIAWGDGWAWKGTFFFLVLLSNAMMATLVCVTVSGRLFYDGWSRNHSQAGLFLGVPILDRKIGRLQGGLLERVMRLLPGVHHATRALVVKDIRVFWRDTSQWSQFVIFFGLLGLYVLNLRNVSYDWNNEFWARFVAFLNLGASSMTLATLTTRFVFPQFSLEGKRLWLLGLVPYGLKRVLLVKFALSSLCTTTITLSLMLLSCWMLKLPVWMTALFGSTVVLMSVSLCGIAIGMGTLFPNFGSGSTANRRDDNPAKIVSGFGGTFCFVLSLIYLVAIMGLAALPAFVRVGAQLQPLVLVGSWLVIVLLSVVAACLPMTLALKRVESLEM